jgi:hypothetical protein
MTGPAASILDPLSAELPGIYEKSQLLSELPKQSDFETAILAASYIDVALRFALSASPADPKIPRSLGQKIDRAHDLGITSDRLKDDLHGLRDIRNLFAHSVLSYSFETEKVRGICLSFQTPRFFADERSALIPGLSDSAPPLPSFYPPDLFLTCQDDAGACRIMARIPEPAIERPATARQCFAEMTQVAWFFLMTFAAPTYYGNSDIKVQAWRRDRSQPL